MARRLACLDIVQALQAPQETTIFRLLEDYDLDTQNLLEAYSELATILKDWAVEFDPVLGVGSPHDVRVLSSISRAKVAEFVMREVGEIEGQHLEFKQTLAMDTKKHEIGKRPASECFSEDVVLSALKTIAGFLNSGGGVLLIGVCDDGSLASIDREFVCTCPKDNLSLDGWELRLRAFIEQYFVDRAAIQPYVDVAFAKLDGATVARVVVGGRSRLSFISKNGIDTLYIRVGNRTQSVSYRDVESYFEMRRR